LILGVAAWDNFLRVAAVDDDIGALESRLVELLIGI
jgi:hypothetical protein